MPGRIAVTVSVLLVVTESQWFGTARAPGALSRAGFEVNVLAPKGSLVTQSQHIKRIAYLEPQTTTQQWLHAFAAMVRATAPLLVLPGDDVAYRLLQALVLAPPEDMQPVLREQLTTLVKASLGDPDCYRTSVEKTRLPAAAQALGVRVPGYTLVHTLDEARAFAAAHGYPVVLKLNQSTGGNGVELISGDSELERAFFALGSANKPDFDGTMVRHLLIQKQISGKVRFQNVAAWHGRIVAAWIVERVIAYPEPKGPSSVNRYYHDAQIRDFSERIVAGFGMTGLFSIEYIVDAQSGDAYLLEINRRITPGSHAGRIVNVDLCAALFAAATSTPMTTRPDLEPGEEHHVAKFPQEWLRDMNSPYLDQCRIDAPWDDPVLFEAMLAMRHNK